MEAGNGVEGLAVAGKERPDLILLDITMPVMDGVEMLTKINSDPELKAIPIIMLTAEGGRDNVLKIAKIGVRDYRLISNPYEAKELIQRQGAELLISDNSLIKLSPNESRSLMGKVEKEIKAIHSSIPIELNENVTNALSAYTTRFRDSVSRGLERCGKYLPMIRSVMAENGLPEDLAVLPLLDDLAKLQ